MAVTWLRDQWSPLYRVGIVIEMRVLGSGSTGNCTVVRAHGRLVMIDAGLGPRTVATRLGPDGKEQLRKLDALLLTHLDRDHFNPAWFATLANLGVTIYCHQKHLYGLYRHPPTTRAAIDARALQRRGLLRPFSDEAFTIDALRHDLLEASAPPAADAAPAVRVQPVPLAHDRSGVFGFDVAVGPTRLGYATDLGRVTESLVHAFRDVNLLAIESNYDPPMQIGSARPDMLKQRIMGGRGHLSNEQALRAVRQIIERSSEPPAHIVLLHLSRQCNCPSVIRKLYETHPELASRLCLTHHKLPTRWLAAKGAGRPGAGLLHQQMRIFVE